MMTAVIGYVGKRFAWGLLATLLCAAPESDAEPKAKKPKPVEAAPAAVARLRVWKDLLAADRPLRVTLRSGKKNVSEVQLGTGLQFLTYQEIAAGNLVAEVVDEAEPKTRLASTTLTLEGEQFFTLLLREKSGHISLEAIDDTPDASGMGGLIVRSFAPGLKGLRIKVGDDVLPKLEGPAPFASFRGLPRQVVQIDTTGIEGSGKQVNWTNELDLKTHQRATLLIVPDAYGRIRPRLVYDGEAP